MTPDPYTQQVRAAQKRRSLATALALVGFVAIVFVITIVRLQGHALNKPF